MSEIEKILEAIRPGTNFAESSDFVADGLLDSLDIIRLVSEIEVFYGIELDGAEVLPQNFSSVTTIWALVTSHTNSPEQ